MYPKIPNSHVFSWQSVPSTGHIPEKCLKFWAKANQDRSHHVRNNMGLSENEVLPMPLEHHLIFLRLAMKGGNMGESPGFIQISPPILAYPNDIPYSKDFSQSLASGSFRASSWSSWCTKYRSAVLSQCATRRLMRRTAWPRRVLGPKIWIWSAWIRCEYSHWSPFRQPW